jgi:hypothetical protein
MHPPFLFRINLFYPEKGSFGLELQEECQIEFLLNRNKSCKIHENTDKSFFGKETFDGHFLS